MDLVRAHSDHSRDAFHHSPQENNKEGKSNNFAERPGESELQKQMVEHMEEVNKNKYEQNQAEINNDDNINLDKEELDKYAGRQNSK